MQGRHLLAAIALATSLALGACGVGGDEGGSGARAINWYAFNEPGGSYDEAVANCNEQANGRYTINYVKLPNIADQQRELLVRRLAAEDDDIDLMSLDVIWTAEFAQAEWIVPWEGERRSAAEEGKLEGPLETVRYEDQIWAIPHTSNTQLLWYRKDRVDPPPGGLHLGRDDRSGGREGHGRGGAGRPVRGPRRVDQRADHGRRRPGRQRGGRGRR